MLKNKIQISILFICIFFTNQSSFAATEIVGSPEDHRSEPAPPPCAISCPSPQVQDSTTCVCSCPTPCTPPLLQNTITCGCSCLPCSAPKTVQNAATCACSCPACLVIGQTKDPSTCACSCPAATPTICDGTCYAACPAGQARNAVTCACECTTAGQTLCGGTCYTACPAGQARNAVTCACECTTAGQTLCGGTCYVACPAGQARNAVTCACECTTAGQTLCGGTCYVACPVVGQTRNAACSCVCPSGKTRCTNTTPNMCATTCASPKVFDSSCSSCVCPPATPVDTNGQCCATGKVYEVGACRIPCSTSAPYRWSDGKCYSCEIEGQTKPGGICKCPKGEGPYNGVCIPCPNGTVYFKGVCEPCDVAGQELGSNGKCKCPSGKTFITDYGCIAGDCILSFDIRGSGNGPDGGGGILDKYSKNSKMPSCLNSIVNTARHNAGVTKSNADGYADDSVAGSIAFSLGGSSRSPEGTFYFDRDCKVLKNTAGFRTCSTGSYSYYQSPVVLLWDQSFTVENLSEDVQLVTFPIDPNQSGKLTEWKVSSNAPLLVYDPSGEGKITNGYQLFGNWTFGPKKVASLDSKSNFTDTNNKGGKLWNNGFDALSKLDLNADGEVSGTELEPLSLWFDDNRNGVAEKGEVRRLSAEGVRKLFYQDYVNNDVANAVVLKVGFERERNGKIEQGTMVDWFSDTVSSEQEYAERALMMTAALNNKMPHSIAVGHIDNNPTIPKDESELLALKNGAVLVKGFWEWDSKSKEVPIIGGRFLLIDNQDGTIRGLTMTESAVVSTFGATSMGLIKSFEGKAKLETDGSVSLTFNLKNEGETFLESTAKLSKGSNSMNGSSRGTVKSDTAKTKLNYKWVATKLQ